jgi:Ran GTPase-activating protein (RanGAP) involved in mRNA processing and transport
MLSSNTAEIMDSAGRLLKGDELEMHCKNRGLCPLCARTRVRKRVFKLFKKNKWEALTVQDKEGNYSVYKGYCVKPNCFSIEQAKRLKGEGGTKNSRRNGAVRSMKSFGGSARFGEENLENGPPKAAQNAFPPKELKNATNYEVHDDQPLFVVQKCVEALQTDKDVKFLDLSSVKLRHVDLSALAAALRVNTTLEGLVMEGCKLEDQGLAIIADALHAATNMPLTKLYLRANMITDDGADSLSKFLESDATLERLDLSRNRIGTAGGVSLFNSFYRNGMTRIRCLNLSHNELWDLDQGNFGIRPFLARNRTLRVLNLEGNFLHDETIESLANGVAENENAALERLYIGSNAVGDDGIVALSKMLEKNDSMMVLGLGQNEVQNAGARALLSALDVNTSLREIAGLWKNHIDRRFIIVAIRRLLLSHDTENSSRIEEDIPISSEEQAPVPSENSQSSHVKMGPQVSFSSHNEGGPSTSAQCEDFYSNALDSTAQPESTKNAMPGNPPLDQQEDRAPHVPLEDQDSSPPFDRLTVFQSSPLAYFDREASMHHPIPFHDFQHEVNILDAALASAIGAKIDVVHETATNDRFTAFFADKEGQVMHLSCFGHPDYLTMENGFGLLHKFPVDGLERLMAAVGGSLRVVFVSSAHARSIGNAFVKAGVPHVVCCRREQSFRDEMAMEFANSFYRGLANNRLLKHAYDAACDSISVSPMARNTRTPLDRFALLPERPDTDPYHNVPVFFTHPVSPLPEKDEQSDLSLLPQLPQHFLGREVDMFEILEAMRVDDLIRVSGKKGSGKCSVVAAACRYMLHRRKSFQIDDIYWLPAPEGVIPDEDSLLGDLCLAINIMKDAGSDTWDDDDLLECRERIELELEDKRALLVIDDREFSSRAAQDSLERFVSHFLNVAAVKIILINSVSRSSDEYSIMSESTMGSKADETNIEIGPLDFKDAALLFGGISKFVASSTCPAAHSAIEFAELCEPTFISKFQGKAGIASKRRSYLSQRMGNGLPSKVIQAASTMSKKDFIEMITIANRPEAHVDSSLGALETEIRRRIIQKQKAIKEKNFLRAMDLDIIIEELEGMRSDFPCLEDLCEEEAAMKTELANAVNSRQYDLANDLKRDMLILKKRILQERSLHPTQNLAFQAGHFMNDIEAQVQSMMDGNASASFEKGQSVAFTVDCDERDCTFEIYAGSITDFDSPSEAKGIVCWTNESCELEGNPIGEKLIQYGGSALEVDISCLPVVTDSPWGPVRCGTGNAVIVGPQSYGELEAPCVILAVGPLSPTNDDHIEADDGDTLHYVRTMLRSCYRSSLVLAKHAQLQAAAISILTTKQTGSAYDETLRIALQTLVAEVKFSLLRELHIIVSSQKEASRLIEIMTEMRIGRV